MSDKLKHELKSCPYCKYPPVLTNIIKDGTWYAECVNHECEMRTAPFSTKTAAIEAWNLIVDDKGDTANMDMDTSKSVQICPNEDSRERLRADVYEGFSAVDLPEQIRDVLRSRVHTWLDRQAAITHAEVFEDGEYDCRTCGAKRELQERVDSLTAERDHFRKHVNHLIALIADIARKQPHTFDPEAPYETLDTIGDYIDELQGDVASLTSERDYWKDQVHQCVMKAVEPGGYTAGIMRYPRTDGYCEPSLMVTDAIDSLKDFYADEKRINDKLTAERDELRKECSRWHVEQVHAYGNWEDVHEYAKKLEAERDELRDKLSEKQRVCDIQRESFRKMERELAEAKAADYTAMKDEIEKLEKRVAELKSENRDLCMKIYGAPF